MKGANVLMAAGVNIACSDAFFTDSVNKKTDHDSLCNVLTFSHLFCSL